MIQIPVQQQYGYLCLNFEIADCQWSQSHCKYTSKSK